MSKQVLDISHMTPEEFDAQPLEWRLQVWWNLTRRDGAAPSLTHVLEDAYLAISGGKQ